MATLERRLRHSARKTRYAPRRRGYGRKMTENPDVPMFKPPPPGLRPMIDFDPSEPAILHDRLSDTIEPWTGEEADDYRKHSIVHPDGAVEWGGFMFDGWGNVLGG